MTTVPWPDTFLVGVRLSQSWSGPGSITIGQKGILLKLWPPGGAELWHTDRSVEVLTTRIPYVVANVHVILHDDRVKGIASIPLWSRRRLNKSLESHGFMPVPRRTWVSMGSID